MEKPRAYESLREFWERRAGQDGPLSGKEEIRRMAEAIDVVSHNNIFDNGQSPNRQPLQPADIDELKSEIGALTHQLYRVGRACQEEKSVLQNVERKCIRYYEMAQAAQLEARRQIEASKKMKKMVRLLSYYLPDEVQRQVQKIVQNMDPVYEEDGQFWTNQAMKALEYRRSVQQLDQGLQRNPDSQFDTSDCRAIIPWKDYRDYWPVYCRSPLNAKNSSMSHFDAYPFYGPYRESDYYGPHRRESEQFPGPQPPRDTEPVYGPHRLPSFHLYPESMRWVEMEESEGFCCPDPFRGCCAGPRSGQAEERKEFAGAPSSQWVGHSANCKDGRSTEPNARTNDWMFGNDLRTLQTTLVSLTKVFYDMATKW